jgi:Domain of unknown function (DUF4281)
MKQLNLLFKVMSAVSMVGWILIATAPSWDKTQPLVTYGVVGMLCVLYVYLLAFARPAGVEKATGNFFSLAGIVSLFKNPQVVLVGWVHFLAFDLMTALFIRHDAQARGFAHGWLLPVYFLTLMFGPAGLLVYFLGLAITQS